MPIIVHGGHWGSLVTCTFDNSIKPSYTVPIHAFIPFSNQILFMLTFLTVTDSFLSCSCHSVQLSSSWSLVATSRRMTHYVDVVERYIPPLGCRPQITKRSRGWGDTAGAKKCRFLRYVVNQCCLVLLILLFYG